MGGGVYVESATANVRNAIVWGNSTTWGSGETAQISVWSPMSFSLMSSCVQNWTSGGLGGSWNTANDPLLADPDGADGIPGTADDDLRLTSGSSAIDTGSNAAVPDDTFDVDRDGDTSEPLPLDLARGDRFLGTGPTVDMGAYEYLNTGDDLGDPTPPAAGAPAPEPSGTAYIAFTYDALGRRVERIVDSGGAQVEVTRYYYDGENVILETDANEAPRRSFVHGSQYIDERVLMRLPDGKEYYYLLRELYSVAALTDEIGEIVEAATYDTYGRVAMYDGSAQAVENSPVGNPYYFTGRRLDLLPLAGGLKQTYHYRARGYDPGNGRFMQRDPLGYTDSTSLYEAFGSAATTRTDPHGTQAATQPAGGNCGADVTYWLVDELNINGDTKPVSGMRFWCCNSFSAIQDCACALRIGQWLNKVKPNGEWDYKVRPGFGACPTCGTGTCGFTVTLCGHCVGRDVPGNINFGFTGTKGCFDPKGLLSGADAESPGGKDSPDDKAAISIGIALGSKTFVTRSDLCAQVNDKIDALKTPGTAGCSPSDQIYDVEP